jgi:hypothetical protein
MADNKIVQTVDVSGPGRYVLKSDGKWYYQLVSGGIVTSESIVKKAEVDQAKASTPAQRGAVSPGGGEQNRIPANTISNEELANQIAQLEGLKKNSDGTYTWQGKKLTPTAYQNQLTSLRNIREERKMAGVFGPEAAAQRVNIQQERDKLVQYIANFSQQLEFAKTIVANTTDTTAYTRAQAWVTKLTADQKTLTGFLNTIDSTGKLPPSYVLPPIPTPQQIQTTSPVSASGTMAGGRPSAGAANVPSGLIPSPSTGPVSAAARGEQGVLAPGQPIAATDQGAVQLPAGIDFGALAEGASRATPAPAVTPPAAGQPATTTPPAAAGTPATATPTTTPAPAGGAVTANGVTLPAGIDFAWLASQTPTTPADWEQAAVELYGGYYEIIKNIPELRGLIGRAMESKWSQDKLQYELEQTTWWKTTTASARAWEEQKVRDPATLQSQIDARIATIKDSALTLGLRLPDTSLARLAEDSLKFGWTEQLLNNAVGMEALKSTGGVSELRQGFYGQSVRSIANQYGVPVSDTFVNQWVAKIATGEENQASYQAYISGLAKNLYPSLSSGLDRGLTFAQMTDPYAQMASNILEIPSSQVDFTDPKWAAAFTMKDSKGQQMQMSYGEWADYLRSTPSFGYEYTDGARNKAYDVVDRLAKMFGAG